jgi:hypothetical protein
LYGGLKSTLVTNRINGRFNRSAQQPVDNAIEIGVEQPAERAPGLDFAHGAHISDDTGFEQQTITVKREFEPGMHLFT